MLEGDNGARLVDEFLSWLRGVLQGIGDGSLVLIVSGSIGLTPLVNRLGIPDRINHLEPFRLGPWDRDISIECFQRLAESYKLRVEDGVANAVYNALGVGIPPDSTHITKKGSHISTRDFVGMHVSVTLRD